LNAVPLPPAQPPRDFNAPVLEIVFLGEVGTRKGVDVLIPALAKIADLPNWRMTIAGNGNIERYKAEAAALGIAERVQFTGWLNPQAAQEILQRGHILVLASRQENLPMSILEAMAYGLVVVSTPVGAVPQVLKDGESGYLVAMGDEDALAAALREALLNPSRSAAMAAKAKRFFAENLTIEAYIPRLVRIYQELIR
ncbi:MAG: glycosyltransferase family 4 protein, partial [Holosporales bacterium]